MLSRCLFFYFTMSSLVASLTFVYLISFLVFFLIFLCGSFFVCLFCRFQFLFAKLFSFFLCVFLFISLCKSIIIFLFYIIFFLMRCKCQNSNIIYIYLNVYLCFYFSASFAFPLLFQWIFFSCLSKVVFCFPLDEIVVFLMFIYLLIQYDRLSLCFVVCFSS